MILLARLIAGIVALVLLGCSVYYIWFMSSWHLVARILVSIATAFISVILGSLVGEHFLKILKSKRGE